MRDIVRNRILKKCKNKCVKCGSIEKLEVDHIIPLSRGGRENEDNMQILCKKCNCKKHNGIDFREFFIIGKHPEYILVKRNLPMGAWTSNELKKILIIMFKENDKLFGLEREYSEGRY